MAKIANNKTEFHDQVPPTDVNWCRVFPAWIATNDGGATPKNKRVLEYRHTLVD